MMGSKNAGLCCYSAALFTTVGLTSLCCFGAQPVRAAAAAGSKQMEERRTDSKFRFFLQNGRLNEEEATEIAAARAQEPVQWGELMVSTLSASEPFAVEEHENWPSWHVADLARHLRIPPGNVKFLPRGATKPVAHFHTLGEAVAGTGDHRRPYSLQLVRIHGPEYTFLQDEWVPALEHAWNGGTEALARYLKNQLETSVRKYDVLRHADETLTPRERDTAMDAGDQKLPAVTKIEVFGAALAANRVDQFVQAALSPGDPDRPDSWDSAERWKQHLHPPSVLSTTGRRRVRDFGFRQRIYGTQLLFEGIAAYLALKSSVEPPGPPASSTFSLPRRPQENVMASGGEGPRQDVLPWNSSAELHQALWQLGEHWRGKQEALLFRNEDSHMFAVGLTAGWQQWLDEMWRSKGWKRELELNGIDMETDDRSPFIQNRLHLGKRK
ncbi:unnamed protein product [Amoebophrya sp. A120]|nr:unnamed protein product [Amoebophrya sp. A120]CAD7924950.1 unnamed protein product [Amoebophrya sp. A120]|eukprot:GSA120T00003037001.1